MINPIEKLHQFCPNCKTPLLDKKLHGRLRKVCPNCNFTFWNNPRPCVSTIILNNKRGVLLLKIASGPLKGQWCLPGGIIEYAEKPEQSLIREVKEETGLNIQIDHLLDVFLIDNDPRGNSMDILYQATPRNTDLKISAEHSEYGFFPLDKLPKPIAYKHRDAILAFVKNK